MTEAERSLARALAPGQVSYLPASRDKRMAVTLSARSFALHSEMTEGEGRELLRLAHRYRRQLDSWTLILAMRVGESIERRG